MNTAADYARQSDPDCNRHFRRRWVAPKGHDAAAVRATLPTQDDALSRIAAALAADARAMRAKRRAAA